MKRLITAFVLLGACGGGPAKTPEDALQKLLDAARANNGPALREAFPSKEELAAAFDCPPDLVAQYDSLSEELITLRPLHTTIPPGALANSTRFTVPAGEEVGGCRARRDVNVVRADMQLHDTSLALRFVEIEGTWRVLGF